MTDAAEFSASLRKLEASLQTSLDQFDLDIAALQARSGNLDAGKLDKNSQAIDSARLGGKPASFFAEVGHTHDTLIHDHDDAYSALDHLHTASQVGAYTKEESNARFLGKTGKAVSSGTADNAIKVNNLTVETAVPAGALFTDTVRDITDSVGTISSEISASASAVRTVKQLVDAAMQKALDVESSMVGMIKHLGNIDLSSGSYPPAPNFSAMWYVSVPGTAGGERYEEGDALAYSADTGAFYQIKDKASLSSVEAYNAFLKKNETAVDSSKLGGKMPSSYALAGHTHSDMYANITHEHDQYLTTESAASRYLTMAQADDAFLTESEANGLYLFQNSTAVNALKLNNKPISYFATAGALDSTTASLNAVAGRVTEEETKSTLFNANLGIERGRVNDLFNLCDHLTFEINQLN